MLERLWGLTEMFPDSVRSAAEVSAHCSLSAAKKLYRCVDGNWSYPKTIIFNSVNHLYRLHHFSHCTFYSFSRAALWVGTTSFMILVLPVVFETERLQLEQQQIQQQRQVSNYRRIANLCHR